MFLVLYSSKSIMGKNQQHQGFTTIELIFVLVLMGIFTVSIASKWFRSEDDVVYKAKVALSEAVFLAKLYSMASDFSTTLSIERQSTGNLNLVVKKIHTKSGYPSASGKYNKSLDSRISNCMFLDFPQLKGAKEVKRKQLYEIVFKEKFFTPFQLKISFNKNEEQYITVDADAQIQTNTQER
jgi:type II secretory pathway pseudopilin PulG